MAERRKFAAPATKTSTTMPRAQPRAASSSATSPPAPRKTSAPARGRPAASATTPKKSATVAKAPSKKGSKNWPVWTPAIRDELASKGLYYKVTAKKINPSAEKGDKDHKKLGGHLFTVDGETYQIQTAASSAGKLTSAHTAWAKGEDVVYAPDLRVMGLRPVVEMFLEHLGQQDTPLWDSESLGSAEFQAQVEADKASFEVKEKVLRTLNLDRFRVLYRIVRPKPVKGQKAEKGKMYLHKATKKTTKKSTRTQKSIGDKIASIAGQWSNSVGQPYYSVRETEDGGYKLTLVKAKGEKARNHFSTYLPIGATEVRILKEFLEWLRAQGDQLEESDINEALKRTPVNGKAIPAFTSPPKAKK